MLPLKTICHYSAEKEINLKKLQEFGCDKDLITCPIKEDEFIVLFN